jgi:hypothetical protein
MLAEGFGEFKNFPASVTPRGVWSEGDSYAALDLVTHRECSRLATRNNPGRLRDGEGGWQARLARPVGRSSPARHRGAKGEPEPPVTIPSLQVDRARYYAVPVAFFCLSLWEVFPGCGVRWQIYGK